MTFDEFRADFTNRLGHPPTALDAWNESRAAEREQCKARAVQIVEWHRNDYNRQQIDPIVAELRNGL